MKTEKIQQKSQRKRRRGGQRAISSSSCDVDHPGIADGVEHPTARASLTTAPSDNSHSPNAGAKKKEGGGGMKRKGRRGATHPGRGRAETTTTGAPSPTAPTTSATDAPSLAQMLKKRRGTAASTPPPPMWTDRRRARGQGGREASAFLDPRNDLEAYEDCLATCYGGFSIEGPREIPTAVHADFRKSFDGMEAGGLFLYDAVRPGGKRLTRTSVTRTLVGKPGSTYRYLGLRLFSHPWTNVDERGDELVTSEGSLLSAGDGDDGRRKKRARSQAGEVSTLRRLGYSTATAEALLALGRTNSALRRRSEVLLATHAAGATTNPEDWLAGSADFNLSLVNRMESAADKRDLKREKDYGMGKTSVGWHRDSGLKDFSTIAVYQSLRGSSLSAMSNGIRTNNDGGDASSSLSSSPWCVALRAMDGGTGGPLSVPPLLVPIPSESAYYLLDEFNHNHEHAVVAASDPGGVRYSSTHRVAREGQGTWQYLREKVDAVQKMLVFPDEDTENGGGDGTSEESAAASGRRPKSGKEAVTVVRARQRLMTEIEFEWLRQWYVQGPKHAGLHSYWHEPMKILIKAFRALERSSAATINLLRRPPSKSDSHVGGSRAAISEDLYDLCIESLVERSALRGDWRERYRDPVFAGMPEDERPFACPCLDRRDDGNGDGKFHEQPPDGGTMPEDLDALVAQLREWRSAFVDGPQQTHNSNGETSSIKYRDVSKKGKKKKASHGSLTKKEQKKKASNWERLKSKLGKP